MKNRVIRRQAMIQAGFSLFAQQGFEKTTMQQIANLASIGVATVFRYFPTKDLLLAEAAKYVIEQQLPLFENILRSNRTGFEKMDEVLSNYILYISEKNNDATKLLETFELYIAYNELDSEVLKDIHNTYISVRSILVEIIREGQRDGSISSSTDSEMIAISITNMFGTAVKKYSLYQLAGNSIIPIPSKEQLLTIKNVLLQFLKSN